MSRRGFGIEISEVEDWVKYFVCIGSVKKGGVVMCFNMGILLVWVLIFCEEVILVGGLVFGVCVYGV